MLNFGKYNISKLICLINIKVFCLVKSLYTHIQNISVRVPNQSQNKYTFLKFKMQITIQLLLLKCTLHAVFKSAFKNFYI